MSTLVINRKTYQFHDFIYIGRGTPFGNSNSSFDGSLSRDESIAAYKYDFDKKIKRDIIFKIQILSLHDKVLGCSCKPQNCHGDIIKNYLDSIENIQLEKQKAYNLFKRLHPNTDIRKYLKHLNI
jgi:hypothetical protein